MWDSFFKLIRFSVLIPCFSSHSARDTCSLPTATTSGTVAPRLGWTISAGILDAENNVLLGETGISVSLSFLHGKMFYRLSKPPAFIKDIGLKSRDCPGFGVISLSHILDNSGCSSPPPITVNFLRCGMRGTEAISACSNRDLVHSQGRDCSRQPDSGGCLHGRPRAAWGGGRG